MHEIKRSAARLLKALASTAVGLSLAAGLESGYTSTKRPASAVQAQTSFGRPADPTKGKRLVRIDVSDQMRYTPSQLEVKQGDVIRFVVANKGRLPHEMVLGTMQDLRKQAELLETHPGAAHEGPHIVRVAPGKTAELDWDFTQAGEFYYACLIPGHFRKWTLGKISVRQGNAGGRS